MGGSTGYLVEGIAGGLQAGHQNAQKKALLDSQTALIKAQAKAAEAELQAQAQEDAWWSSQPPEMQSQRYAKGKDSFESKLSAIQKLFAGQGTAEEVPLPEYDPGSGTPPFREGATMSVPQQVAAGQLGGLTHDDFIRGLMKKEFGAESPTYNRTATVSGPDGNPWVVPMNNQGVLDMTKAMPAPVKADMQPGVSEGMAPVQTPVNPYTRQPVGASVQTGPPPTMQVETPTPGGGKSKSVVLMFPGAIGSKVTGTTAGGIRTELDLLDVPIPASDVTKWSDGGGNNPPVGWTPRQAQGRGFKQTQEGMPAETGGKVVMLAQAVTDMEKAISMILPAGGGFNRKLAIGAATNAPEFAVSGSQVVRSSILNAMSAKLRMETGAQSNESEIQGIVDRYWPSGVRDNEKSARYKTGRLLSFMKDGKFIMDPKGRIVVVDPPSTKAKPSLGVGKKGKSYRVDAAGNVTEVN